LAKPALPPFSWTLRIYWEDTDAGGIVFYANYLKFFERARTEWLRSLGIEQQALRAQSGGMFIVSQTQVRHLLPCRLDDEIIVTAGLLESGRASMTIQQQAFLKTPGQPQLLAEASIRIGWVNATSLKPARLPTSILDSLEKRS
jgi:acyl-CoA thioester hydrolase